MVQQLFWQIMLNIDESLDLLRPTIQLQFSTAVSQPFDNTPLPSFVFLECYGLD